jgi:hypothetical protein
VSESREDPLPLFLETLENWAKKESIAEINAANRWSRWSVWLTGLAAMGTAAAGSAVALSERLTDSWRIFVVLIAFLATALGAAAAGLGGPQRTSAHRTRGNALSAWARAADVLREIDFAQTDRVERRRRFQELLIWLDDLEGVNGPDELRKAPTTSGGPSLS